VSLSNYWLRRLGREIEQYREAVARFALAYADQNQRDCQALLKAIRDGRIPTLEE
jgi:hypothetical protein